MQLFLGTLREAEVERVNQRISQAIIETCLAMTIFRDEFNVKFVALFTVLSFIKVFHWLVQDRCALFARPAPDMAACRSFHADLLECRQPACISTACNFELI